MSDDAPQKPADGEPPLTSVKELSPFSATLQTLLAHVHEKPASKIPMTLATPTGVLIGLAVHPAVWHREMAEQVRTWLPAMADDSGDNKLAEVFDGIAGNHDGETDDYPLDSVTNVYLTRASLYSPDQRGNPLLAQCCWYVPLSQVSSWTIGIPNFEDAPDDQK